MSRAWQHFINWVRQQGVRTRLENTSAMAAQPKYLMLLLTRGSRMGPPLTFCFLPNRGGSSALRSMRVRGGSLAGTGQKRWLLLLFDRCRTCFHIRLDFHGPAPFALLRSTLYAIRQGASSRVRLIAERCCDDWRLRGRHGEAATLHAPFEYYPNG